MAPIPGNRIAWTYTDELGNQYRVAAQKGMTDQAKLGGAAAAATVPQRPNTGRMRRCSVSDGSGRSRVVTVYTPDAPITAAGETISANVDGDSHTLTSNGGYLQEDTPRRNATKQST